MKRGLYLKYKEATRRARLPPDISTLKVEDIPDKDLIETYKMVLSKGSAAGEAVRDRILFQEKYISLEERDRGHLKIIENLKSVRDDCLIILRKIEERYQLFLKTLKKKAKEVKKIRHKPGKKPPKKVNIVEVDFKKIEEDFLEEVEERNLLIEIYQNLISSLLQKKNIEIDNDLAFENVSETIGVRLMGKSLSLQSNFELKDLIEKTRNYDCSDLGMIVKSTHSENDFPLYSIGVRYYPGAELYYVSVKKNTKVRDIISETLSYIGSLIDTSLQKEEEKLEIRTMDESLLKKDALVTKILKPKEKVRMTGQYGVKFFLCDILISGLTKELALNGKSEKYSKIFNYVNNLLMDDPLSDFPKMCMRIFNGEKLGERGMKKLKNSIQDATLIVEVGIKRAEWKMKRLGLKA